MKNARQSQTNIFLSICTVLFVIFLDRISKIFFCSILSFGEFIPVIRNVFHFTLVYNTGIAFGLFKNQGIVFIIIPIIAIILIGFNIYYYRNSKHVSRLYIISFSMILGGAIGNLIDRIVYGHVIDFIDFRVWPVFNIADSAITIGTILILIKCIPSFAK